MTSSMIAPVVDDPQQRAGTQYNRQAANVSLDIRMEKFHCFSLHNSKEMEPAEVSPDRWMGNEMWRGLYPMQLYPAIREREITKFAGKRFDLQYVILCEVTQTQEEKESV